MHILRVRLLSDCDFCRWLRILPPGGKSIYCHAEVPTMALVEAINSETKRAEQKAHLSPHG